VIIPSYNSESTIRGCLTALTEQETDFEYEVLVVDSSSDGTGDVVASEFPSVRLLRLARQTFPGAARNLAIEVSRGEILAFTDADCVPEPRWLAKMVRQHESCGYAGVGGTILNGRPRNPVAWSQYLVEFSEGLPGLPRRFVEFLPTCNASFRRSTFERHGLFSTELQAAEDRMFGWRLVRAGERLLFDPDIRVEHIFRTGVAAFLKHQAWLGRGAAEARRRTDLPHAWLVDHPLRWLSPLMRLAALETRLARWDRANLLRFNLLLPLCVSGLVAWGVGFCDGGRGGNGHRP
jgi:GT2 family glycosyltransferase